ncbi:hypothetical protein A2767_07060 [Candidatus Roizmanbacteria bacterium RIFCSPHIGHO2_01_FULL_35_10]|uniref:Methyltransferase type 11 domain-containing protein n=1 Tax=Candidatus Roizmanbacteria bacterium RIFCSPLOWO2_01_FULL_35_13 TaxID=1802055 RepID=A0A1F7IFC6_9BACT|nr:MAG: hypothetical protein A2767_07060 [Candidatus Roizmanbacteria bacterium RIFCSPHIGHO2_01_FULL_35_10]OGK42054.1 MAG: hypothetical protein A3A74_00225 [Candidatus Roizmanbacteria bacterium RIFCSPLOWO2_01_FULL_35_13]
MTDKKLLATKKIYEDPVVVAGYFEANGSNFNKKLAKDFSESLQGKKIIDIGCGPGHYSNYFSHLGLETVGVDYSKEMIKKAEKLKPTNNSPMFVVADMRDLGTIFEKNSFHGAWANASLLHIPEEDIESVLKEINKIVKNKGKVFISLKKGKQGLKPISENRYGKNITRQFIFWRKNNFEKLAKQTGFKIEKAQEVKEGFTGNEPTIWLRFFLKVVKD